MLNSDYLLLLLGMAIATYIPRWLPLAVLAGRSLPGWFIEWLDLIPPAIFAALLLPLLITMGEPRHLAFFRPELLVAIPTFIFAIKTKSMGGTIILGMLLFWLAGKIMP